jgi:hypothetical protein
MGHRFFIVAADGTAAHCLDAELIPDVITSVDPSIRILRWFGDVIGANDEDEYFLKDRDAPKNNKALLTKERTITLFDRYGEKLTVAVNPFTNEQVVDRLMSIGAELYLYLPMSDDKQFMEQMWSEHPRLTALNAGGNCGTLAYNLARFLGAREIALCGFDMGYPPGTPLEETQYFDLIAKNPEIAERMFFKVKNPNLEEVWFTDIVYALYAHTFLGMARDAKKNGIRTVNCTGGGIISDPSIEWMTLSEYLKGTIRAM